MIPMRFLRKTGLHGPSLGSPRQNDRFFGPYDIEAYAKLAKPFRWTYTDPQKRIRINEITGTAY